MITKESPSRPSPITRETVITGEKIKRSLDEAIEELASRNLCRISKKGVAEEVTDGFVDSEGLLSKLDRLMYQGKYKCKTLKYRGHGKGKEEQGRGKEGLFACRYCFEKHRLFRLIEMRCILELQYYQYSNIAQIQDNKCHRRLLENILSTVLTPI